MEMASQATAAEQGQRGGYAVELYFDPALENQVLKAWNVLARRQISTHLIEIESRPHITLFSFPPSVSAFMEPQKLLPSLRSFAARHEPLPLTFSFIGAFQSAPSLFLAATPSAGLLSLHSQLFDLLRKDGFDILEEFRPDFWVPHCAVAQDLPKNKITDAFNVLRDLKLPVSGYTIDVGIVEFSPVVREIFSFSLGSASDA
ncbi:uncharacterized protein LOC144713190 [Wolffia australiana]